MPKPNILLITSDQQHFDTLGVNNPKIKTPAFDRLCREGTRFDRAYCPNPTCTPTRASIITGLYPSVHGAWSLGTKLPEDVPTVGQAMHAAGYDTSLIGKAHFQPLQSDPAVDCESIECQPLLRDLDYWRSFNETHTPWYGFDHVEMTRNHGDESHAGQHYAIWLEEKGVKNWRDYFEFPDPQTGYAAKDQPRPKRHGAWELPAELHYTTWTAERSMARIEHCADENKPFFCWSSFHDPHPPYVVPEPWASMYDPADMEIGHLTPGEHDANPLHFALTQTRGGDFSPWNETRWANHGMGCHLHTEERMRKDMAIYYGMTSFMDQQIGRILDKLDELGLAEDTLIVFTTDHGHFLGQHGLNAKGPFHYEDVIKLPFIVRWKGGNIPAGAVSEAIQSLVDLAPTFLNAVGKPAPGLMQGVNQLPVWRGDAPKAREAAIVENRHQPTAIHVRTMVTDRYKLTVYRDHDYGELFDLKEDPGEVRNRWNDPAYAQIKCDLYKQLVNEEIKREPTRIPRVAHA